VKWQQCSDKPILIKYGWCSDFMGGRSDGIIVEWRHRVGRCYLRGGTFWVSIASSPIPSPILQNCKQVNKQIPPDHHPVLFIATALPHANAYKEGAQFCTPNNSSRIPQPGRQVRCAGCNWGQQPPHRSDLMQSKVLNTVMLIPLGAVREGSAGWTRWD
jgi:hypothetical protein